MTGIAEMFADLDGRDLYERAIERWAAWTRARIAATNYAHVKRWRKQNPEKFRAQRKRNLKVWAKRYPEKLRALKTRYRDRHREAMRVNWRKNSKAYRQRKLVLAATEVA